MITPSLYQSFSFSQPICLSVKYVKIVAMRIAPSE